MYRFHKYTLNPGSISPVVLCGSMFMMAVPKLPIGWALMRCGKKPVRAMIKKKIFIALKNPVRESGLAYRVVNTFIWLPIFISKKPGSLSLLVLTLNPG